MSSPTARSDLVGTFHCQAQYIPVVPAAHGPIFSTIRKIVISPPSPWPYQDPHSVTFLGCNIMFHCWDSIGALLLHSSINRAHGDFFDTEMLWLRSTAVNMDTCFMHLLLTVFIVPFSRLFKCNLLALRRSNNVCLNIWRTTLPLESLFLCAYMLVNHTKHPPATARFTFSLRFQFVHNHFAKTLTYLSFEAQQRMCRHDIIRERGERSDDELPLCDSLNSSTTRCSGAVWASFYIAVWIIVDVYFVCVPIRRGV